MGRPCSHSLWLPRTYLAAGASARRGCPARDEGGACVAHNGQRQKVAEGGGDTGLVTARTRLVSLEEIESSLDRIWIYYLEVRRSREVTEPGGCGVTVEAGGVLRLLEASGMMTLEAATGDPRLARLAAAAEAKY